MNALPSEPLLQRGAAQLALPGARLSPSEGRAIIARHSKSFSLASLLLGQTTQLDAHALYAYCRRADDAIDLVTPREAPLELARLRRELDDIYAGRSLPEPILAELQRVVFERHIPRAYPEALLEGFRLDALGVEYRSLEELLHYCWCVAGSVGAMMCHVLGVRRERALVRGVHLGMAMQLTNVCRDVAEDFERGRLYVPLELLPGVELPRAAGKLPLAARKPLALAVRRLLAQADLLYRSGDLGLPYLSFRSRLAVATARRVYSAIGRRILAGGADALSSRAVVPVLEKLTHAARAAGSALVIGAQAPRFQRAELRHTLRFPEDVLPR